MCATLCDHIMLALYLCFIVHCDITMNVNIAMGTHCDITMESLDDVTRVQHDATVSYDFTMNLHLAMKLSSTSLVIFYYTKYGPKLKLPKIVHKSYSNHSHTIYVTYHALCRRKIQRSIYIW